MLKTKTIAGIAVICCIISGNAYAFDDVPVGSEYYRQIEALSKSGIINGYEDNTFTVSYTHLDVYKRQVSHPPRSLNMCALW